MVGRSPGSAQAGLATKLAAALLGLVVPAGVGAGFWQQVRAHPTRSIALLIGYWLVLGIASVLAALGGALRTRWVPRLTDAVDPILTAVWYGHRRHYLRQLGDSVADIELLGVRNKGDVLALREVYVDVSLVPRPVRDSGDEPFVGALPGSSQARLPLASFLTKQGRSGTERVLAVIGGPGSGKTTLLRRTALGLTEGRRRGRPIPVLLYLRDHAKAILSATPPTVAEVAAAAPWLAGKVPAEWIGRQLDRGSCLVMLDGLDEVADPADRGRIVVWAKGQIDRYRGNQYLVTSRPHGYWDNSLPGARVLAVRRFTAGQIAAFLHAWYKAIETRTPVTLEEAAGGKAARALARAQDRAKVGAEGLLNQLRARPALYDLAANPLLLTMIATVHRYRGALPGSRAGLYGEMCQVLLYLRQDDKGLTDPTGLSGEQKDHLAQVLALAMMTERVRDISKPEAHKILGPALTRVAPKVRPQDFLSQVVGGGLLVERESGVYSFAHLTLQEFLAAAHVAADTDRAKKLIAAVNDPWWRETTLLWAASRDASPVVQACLSSGTVAALSLAFDCADQPLSIDPKLREQLDDLLTHAEEGTAPNVPSASGNHSTAIDLKARRRLLTAVKVTRMLREVIHLEDGTAITAHPVTHELYGLYARDAEAHDRFPSVALGPGVASDKPLIGIWPGDAQRFLSWVNGLFDDGTNWRLPTSDEVTDPAIGLAVDLTCHTVVTDDPDSGGAGLSLYCPHGVTNPYQPRPGFLRNVVAADRRITAPGLYSAIMARALGPVIDQSFDPTDNLTRDLARELGINLDRDQVIARARAIGLNLGFGKTIDAENDDTRTIDLAIDLARAVGLDPDRGHEQNPDLLSSGRPRFRILVRSYLLLIRLWLPQITQTGDDYTSLEQLDTYLTSIFHFEGLALTVPPQDVTPAIRRATAVLFKDSVLSPAQMSTAAVARPLASSVVDLTTAVLEKQTIPATRGALVSARIGLLAITAALVSWEQPEGEMMNDLTRVELHVLFEAQANLRIAMCGLIALQDRVTGRIRPNETLLLVRS